MISSRLFFTIGSLYIVNEHCAVNLRDFLAGSFYGAHDWNDITTRELFLVQHTHQIVLPRDKKMARTHDQVTFFDSMCLEHMICINP
jgi:hypothetical protein